MKVINNKQKVLLCLIEEMQKRGIKEKTFLEKALFLLKKEQNIDEIVKFYSFYPSDEDIVFYSFFPHKFGPFSAVSYDDLDKLRKDEFLTETLEIMPKGQKIISGLDKNITDKVKRVVNNFKSTQEIMSYIYKNYPEYTVKSELIEHTKKIIEPGIFTIGYEGLDIDAFLDIMIKNSIQIVVDVRFNPFSMNFDFIRKKLSQRLDKVGIQYENIKSLGIEGSLRKNLNSNEDYKKLFIMYREQLADKKEDIDKVIELGKENRIALLCFERDKNMCHRGVLAEELDKKGMLVAHL